MKYNLSRFVEAQNGSYEIAKNEICQGKKKNHWMWYIFPQIRGLGYSATSIYYGISSIDEAKEYLKHPILGKRLYELTIILLELNENNASNIFGSIDALKLRSSLTLFDIIEPNSYFSKLLDKFFNGKRDYKTIDIIYK